MKLLTSILILSALTSTAQAYGSCEYLLQENDSLRWQLSQCQIAAQPHSWSCQVGCAGIGNVGFGTGRTEAEARKAAMTDLGMSCSPAPTFDCHIEY